MAFSDTRRRAASWLASLHISNKASPANLLKKINDYITPVQHGEVLGDVALDVIRRSVRVLYSQYAGNINSQQGGYQPGDGTVVTISSTFARCVENFSTNPDFNAKCLVILIAYGANIHMQSAMYWQTPAHAYQLLSAFQLGLLFRHKLATGQMDKIHGSDLSENWLTHLHQAREYNFYTNADEIELSVQPGNSSEQKVELNDVSGQHQEDIHTIHSWLMEYYDVNNRASHTDLANPLLLLQQIIQHSNSGIAAFHAPAAYNIAEAAHETSVFSMEEANNLDIRISVLRKLSNEQLQIHGALFTEAENVGCQPISAYLLAFAKTQ